MVQRRRPAMEGADRAVQGSRCGGACPASKSRCRRVVRRLEKGPPRAWTRPAQGRSRGHVGGGRSAMLEVQEPVVEPGPMVRRLNEPEPMVLKAVEVGRSVLCRGS